MGIKKGLKALITREVTTKIVSSKTVNSAVQKVSEAVVKSVNTTTQKIQKAAGEKTAVELMAKSKINTLLFQIPMPSLGTVTTLLTGKGEMLDTCSESYRIKDAAGNLRFRVISDNGAYITTHTLINSVGSEVGYIEEPFVSVGLPLIERDVKKCTIYLYGSKVCILKKGKYQGNLFFESSGKGIRIYHNKEGTDFKIRYAGRRVAHLNNAPLHFDSGYMDSFIMEYDTFEDEIIGVLLSIGVNLINK